MQSTVCIFSNVVHSLGSICQESWIHHMGIWALPNQREYHAGLYTGNAAHWPKAKIVLKTKCTPSPKKSFDINLLFPFEETSVLCHCADAMGAPSA